MADQPRPARADQRQVRIRPLIARTLLPVLLGTAAALCALPGSAGAVLIKMPSGAYANLAPLAGGHGPTGASRMFDAAFSNLDYGGGPVMPSNTNYTVVWQPLGYSFQSGYVTGVDQFFTDLGAASGTSGNSDAVSAQYNDAYGDTAAYASSNGGVISDSDSFPANGCAAGTICLTDAQVQAELEHLLAGHPADLAHEYFLLTPPNVVICADSSSSECSANATENQYFCAYHSRTGAGYVYAMIPDLVGNHGCDMFAGDCPGVSCAYPNGPADAMLSAISHEHNESTTDPDPGTAWADWQACSVGSPDTCGGEIGDKCNSDEMQDPSLQRQDDGFGHDTPYNETINGHHYLLQREWSNQTGRCLDSFTANGHAASASFTASAPPGATVTFDAGGSTATGGVAEFVWQFNDGPGQTTTFETTSPVIEHTFPASGTYQVALTAMGSDGTSSGTASTVAVAPPPPPGAPVAAFTSSGPAVVGTPVTFNAGGSTGASVYSWNFGDGVSTTSSSPTVVHVFAAARSYTVTLTVSNGFGMTNSITEQQVVTARPNVTPVCLVPRLKGKSLSAAGRALLSAHCRTGHVSKPRQKPRRRGRWTLVVARSAPGAGARELAGSGISLILTYVRG